MHIDGTTHTLHTLWFFWKQTWCACPKGNASKYQLWNPQLNPYTRDWDELWQHCVRQGVGEEEEEEKKKKKKTDGRLGAINKIIIWACVHSVARRLTYHDNSSRLLCCAHAHDRCHANGGALEIDPTRGENRCHHIINIKYHCTLPL